MIQQRGKSWRVRVYAGRDPISGKERHVHRTTRGTKTDAKRLEAKLALEVSEGHHQSADITVAQLLDAWLDHAAPDLSPTTVYNYRRYIDRLILPNMGSRRLGKVTTAHHDRLYRDLRAFGGQRGQGLSPATIRQVHAILRRAFTQAKRWGWVTVNPAELASPPRLVKTATGLPSPEQIGQLIEHARSPEMALAIWLAAVTGVRRGELCGLRWSDLDDSSLVVQRSIADVAHTLTVKDTKTHQARRIALDQATLERLRVHRLMVAERALAFGAALGPDAYVLSESPDGSEPLHPDIISDRFRKLAARLGVKCRLHDLRHWSVTFALAAGVPVRTVSGRSGHAPETMFKVYSHFLEASDREAAEVLAKAISG